MYLTSLLVEGSEAAPDNMGYAIAMFGVALAVLLCGVGSTLGLLKTSSAAAGVLGEKPNIYGKLILLVLLPATQGLYGLVIGIVAMGKLDPAAIQTVGMGWAIFCSVLPIAVTGLVTGIFQGKAASNCIYAVGKKNELSGKLMLFPAMIEFYAILGLVISIILVSGI